MAIGSTVTLAPGTTVDEVATVLRFVVSRHQSRRTRLRFQLAPAGIEAFARAVEAVAIEAALAAPVP